MEGFNNQGEIQMQFRSLRKPIAGILILLMTSSLAIGTFTPPAEAGGIKKIAEIVLSVIGAITGTGGFSLGLEAKDNAKRAEFTKRMIDELNREYPGYNAVITHHKSSKAEGPSVIHDHVELPMSIGTKGYEVFLSPKGQPFKFVLNGDGGYINWAYGGDFHRDHHTLTAK
jgi:hypothetical protein